jgi:hypothetical protein
MEKVSEDSVEKQKDYIKPKVTRVELAPSEIVLGCAKQLGEPGCAVPLSI